MKKMCLLSSNNLSNVKLMQKVFMIILFFVSLSFSKQLAHQYFRVNDSVVIVRGDWGICGAVGIAYHHYDAKNLYWFGNHGGPDFELGVMYKNFSVVGFFRPWTLNGNRDVIIDNDTLYMYAKFNDIKIGLNASFLICLTDKFWIEPLIGINKTTFHVIKEEELRKKYNIPSYNGLNYGLGIHYVPTRRLFTFPIVSIWTSFSNADARNILPQLGTWFWQTSITFSFKLWGSEYVLYNMEHETK